MGTSIRNSISVGSIQLGTNTPIPPEPPVTPEFDTVDFSDTDFETGETT